MRVFLIKDKNTKIEISKEIVEVEEGIYTLMIADNDGDEIYSLYKNNEFHDNIDSSVYVTNINLINKIGYSKFEILNSKKDSLIKFIIHTNTYKLKKESFIKMLNFISENALDSHGQFIYYNRLGNACNIVTPIFMYNWINQNIEQIIDMILKINNDYMKNIEIINRKVFYNTGNYNNAKTHIFLKNNPCFMVENKEGIITHGEKRYLPQVLINNYTYENIELNENLYILELILYIYNFCDSYSKKDKISAFKKIETKLIKTNLNDWKLKLSYVRNNTFLSQIPIQSLKNIKRYLDKEFSPNRLEYKKLYDLYIDFISIHYSLVEHDDTYIQHISNIDKIYESFCCYILADILNLKKVNGDYLNKGLAFKNESLELYYQAKPSCMKGWAIDDIPDIVLLNRKVDNSIVILDSKFKLKKNENVKTEDIQKIQSYLNNYSINVGGVLYPGDRINSITDNVNNFFEIVSIPIYPWDNDIYNEKKEEISLKLNKLITSKVIQ